MSKILVVDDNADFRTTLADLLRKAKHDVEIATNEQESLTAIMGDAFEFAVIDVHLHGDAEDDESGLILAMAMRHFHDSLRIIFVTGYMVQTEQVVRAAKLFGAIDFVKKTPDVAEFILAAIENTLDQTTQFDSEKPGGRSRLSLSLTPGQPLHLRSRGRFAYATRTWKVFRADVERFARRVEIARKGSADLEFQVREIGSDMWRSVFGENEEANEAIVTARSRSEVLSLSFETSREFLALPFEFMRKEKPQEYLVLKQPVVRFICDVISGREALSPSTLARMKRLCVLIIASNTRPRIDGVDAETAALCSYLKQQKAIPIDVTLLTSEQATYSRVQSELANPKYDIIHYAGHGSFNASSPDESSLHFWSGENKQEPVVPMKATEFNLLVAQSSARLVYLSCCLGTTTGSMTALLDDDFLGLADATVHAGVPSVLGFRWPVSDSGARRLALAFYQSLLEQGCPDVALWRARCQLRAHEENDTTWLSPILIHQE